MVLHLAAIITSCVGITSCGVTDVHGVVQQEVVLMLIRFDCGKLNWVLLVYSLNCANDMLSGNLSLRTLPFGACLDQINQPKQTKTGLPCLLSKFR